MVTREFSDWSVIPSNENPKEIWIKLLRKGDFVEISFSIENKNFTMLRLSYFPPNIPVNLGLYCCAPQEKGFQIEFENFSVTELKY